jgi:hypothetical protein
MVVFMPPIYHHGPHTATAGDPGRLGLGVLFDFCGVVRGVAAEHETQQMPHL